MRFLPFTLLLGAATWAATVASSASDSEEDLTRENTYFNGKKVPPLLELTEDNWDKEVNASQYLLVKYFNPHCGFCIDFAPTFQTLYEFYYTSHPSGSGNEHADFTTFYDFRFASLNCMAYGDLCSSHKRSTFPITVLFKDGEVVGEFKGAKTIKSLNEGIEVFLEKAKPGTRPANLTLPKAGDNSSPEPEPVKSASAEQETQPAELSKSAMVAPTATATAPNRAVSKETKPTVTPNQDGQSVPLSAETFQTLVTMTQEPWFVKFYAPWCHHCQSMAASWDQLAKRMEGRLNIGEVNCDAESRLCKDVRLKGYPTILFFKGGERVEYDGLRGLGDFVNYAEKAIDISRGVQDVDADSYSALEEKEDVIFIYFYDHATTSEDFRALDKLPLSLIGRAKLVKTQDPKLYERFKISTWPRLLAAREGRPTYYTPLTPKEMRNTRKVLGWMKSVWLPIVPELTASNAREVMDGKLVVLGILNRDDQDAFQSAKREMKSAANEWMDKQIQLFQLERQELRDAKQLRIDEAEDRGDTRGLRAAKSIRINMDKSERKQVAFAWVDGVFWQRWIRSTYGIDVKDGEKVIINDEDNRRYWDQTITGNFIVPSRTSILETLNKVTASPPKIKPKLTVSSLEKIFFDVRITFMEHPYLTMGCILGLGLGCASWFKGRFRRNRGNFQLDDSAGAKESKAPLLGANSNGKVD